MKTDPQALSQHAVLAENDGEYGEEEWSQGRQYVIVKVSDNTLAIELPSTSLVFERPPITPVPNTPEWIHGVCNVRGEIYSIVDIHPFLGFAAVPPGIDPLILLLEGPKYTCGVAVQAVSELVRIQDSEIVKPPDRASYISGLYHRGQDTLKILDVNALLNSPEMMQYQ